MGYIVDFDELDSSFATAYTQCSNWITSLQAVQSAFTALNESVNMSGNGADNIRLYIEAVHYTIIGGIGAVMEAHWKNFLAYKAAYQKQVDTGLHAHINVDNLGTLHEHLGNQKTYARQIDNELGLALGRVSDIFRVSYADITVVDELYKDARDFLTQTADSISNLENAHVTVDFENTDVLLQNLRRFLQEQLEQNRSYKENFSAEAISQSPSIRDLVSSYDLVATELGNKEELYTAAFANEEERSAALQKEAEEAEERAKKAKIEKWIVTGLCVVGSAVVIIGSGGSATPLVVASVSAVSGAIISGNNNAMDQYVANGRVTDWGSVAGNAAIGGITGFITGYLGAAGSTAITNSLSTAGSTLINSSSMLVRVTTNAAIGSTSQVVTGMASRGAGSFTETMIRSGGNVFESLDAAADSAFDLHSIAYDGIIGGVSGGVSGEMKSSDNNLSDQLDDTVSGDKKAEILAENRERGRAFEKQEFEKFSSQYDEAVEQVTIKTPSGVKTRVDAIGLDDQGNVVIYEFKSSKTATLTNNQKIAFPEITESGAVVVGKGKGIFENGYPIKPGTQVVIKRPS